MCVKKRVPGLEAFRRDRSAPGEDHADEAGSRALRRDRADRVEGSSLRRGGRDRIWV